MRNRVPARRPHRLGPLTIVALVCTLPATTRADEVADFYKGKSITLAISVGEGDGMDKAARLIARHWTNHIPGHPSIVPKNMPGAGSLRAAAYLANQAPSDGTALGAIIPAFVLQQLLGSAAVTFDASKLNWLGSSNTSNSTIYVWHTTGVKTLADATKTQVLLGGTGAGSNSVLYPSVLNNVLGTRFRVVMGYRSSPEATLAMTRGEVQGHGGETFNTLMTNHPDWVTDGKVNILVQLGETKEPGFENIPLTTEFAKDQASRDVLAVFNRQIALGRPYLAPPGVPAERVAALRASFAATMQDPAFLADAAKMRLSITPTPGEKLQNLIAALIGTRADVLARTKAALETKDSVAREVKRGDK